MTFTLYADVPPSETYQLLRYAAQYDSYVWFELSRDSGISDAEIYIIKLKKQTSYRNSFSPIFYGVITPREGGSVINGQFKMHPLVRAFVGCWLALGILPGIGGIFAGWTLDSIFCNSIVFPAWMIFLLLLGRVWLGGNEERYIKNFLINAFRA
jgi:hypothetical protein